MDGITVVVIDNASGEAADLAAQISANGWGSWASVVAAERNGGFSYGNNLGMRSALSALRPPEFFVLLNPDTEVRPGALGHLKNFMLTHPEVGIVGPSYENQDGSPWPIAFQFPNLFGQFEQAAKIGIISKLLRRWIVAKVMPPTDARVDWVAGACMMIRRDVVNDVGLMDEDYFLYFEEVDFCLQAQRAGWPCWYVPASRVMHISGYSTGVSGEKRNFKPLPDYWFASRTRYFAKNFGLSYARLIDAACIVGLTFSLVKRILTRQESSDPPRYFYDFVKTSVLFMSKKRVVRRIRANNLN